MEDYLENKLNEIKAKNPLLAEKVQEDMHSWWSCIRDMVYFETNNYEGVGLLDFIRGPSGSYSVYAPVEPKTIVYVKYTSKEDKETIKGIYPPEGAEGSKEVTKLYVPREPDEVKRILEEMEKKEKDAIITTSPSYLVGRDDYEKDRVTFLGNAVSTYIRPFYVDRPNFWKFNLKEGVLDKCHNPKLRVKQYLKLLGC